jgi:spore coat protein M/HSP20 family protein
MTKKKHPPNQVFDLDLVEKWLENYFLDPLTSYYDQAEFRIDLLETDHEWIVEAILNDFDASEIKVFIDGKKLIITATKYPPAAYPNIKKRCIEFPFVVVLQEVMATFSNGILEIFISKTQSGSGKNRYITLP